MSKKPWKRCTAEHDESCIGQANEIGLADQCDLEAGHKGEHVCYWDHRWP